jgi:hypothetical protein
MSSICVYWQCQREDRTNGLAGLDPQAPPVCFDNRAANGKANPQAFGLRTVKRIEHPIEIRGVQARPGVSNGNAYSVGPGSAGADSQVPPLLGYATHGFDRVGDEVQDHLLQLYSIGVNER